MKIQTNHFFRDTAIMLGRSMKHIFRSMDTIITVCITPIAIMLLFVYEGYEHVGICKLLSARHFTHFYC